MDIRAYYQKVRKAEAEIASEHAVVVSVATSDGGKEGIKTEVGRFKAARLIVEGKARLATTEESGEYHAAMQESRRLAEEAEASSKVQVTLISDADLRALQGKAKPVRA